MAKNPSLSFLYDESCKGHFGAVHNNLIVKKINLDTKGAIKILCGVCSACHLSCSFGGLFERDLVDLVKCLVRLIQLPSDELYEHYSQSAFHIIKYLLKMKSFGNVLDLESFLIPEFMPLILNEKQLSVYKSTCTLIYNTIVTTSREKNINQTSEIIRLSLLLFKLYRKLDLKSKACEGVHNCLCSLIILEVPLDQLVKFYKSTLLDRIDPALLLPLLNNFSVVYTHCLKLENFGLASQCYNMTCGVISGLSGSEFRLLRDVLKILEWLNPGNVDSMTGDVPEKVHENLRSYYKFYNSGNLAAVCDVVSSVAYTVLQYYKKKNYWVEKVPVHGHFYKCLFDVGLIMSKTPYSCPCKCSCRTNFNEALRALNTLGSLGKLCIGNTEATRSYKLEIYKYLEKHLDYLRLLKANGCEKWSNHWYDLGVILYGISVHSYNKKDEEIVFLFCKKFIQILIEMEGFTPQKIETTFLISAFNMIADSYYQNREFDKCMLVAALNIIVTECPKSINTWLRAKSEARSNSLEEDLDLQKVTLVSICQKFESEVSLYIKDLKLDSNRKIDLLVYELKQYSLKWKSKVPMCATFQELSKLASTQLLADVFIEVWGDGDLSVDENLPRLLHEVIKKTEVDEVPQKGLILAHLYFLHHRYKVKDTIVKHCDEMERTLNMTKVSSEVVDGVVPDPNADCDLVSSYECLKLTRYIIMMKELNKSFDLLVEFLAKNEEKSDRLFKLLSNVAHEFALHCNVAKSVQAWKLALKVANTPVQIVQASGFLMELTDVRKSRVKKIIAEAESHLGDLLKNKNNEELVVYYLCKSEAHFYVDFESSHAAFRQALSLHQSKNGIVEARFFLLHHKFVTLPCRFNVEEHREYSLVKIHQANCSVTTYYTEVPGATSYDMRIFFEVYEELARMYHDLRLPREVRCYAKDIVLIAQRMVLPMRTLSLLYYLAYADINTCVLDGGRVKIKDLSDILGLGKGKNVATPLKGKAILKEIENLAGVFGEMMLDVPQKTKSGGSPTFAAETFKLPQFLSHREDCTCYYCTCVEYHLFVLKKTYLNALLLEHEGQFRAAKDYFFGCLKIYDILEDREGSFLRKMGLAEDLVPSPREKLAEVYCLALFEYGNFLLRNKQVGEADTLNSRVLPIIQPYKSRYLSLYNEILAQKLNILAWKMIDPPKPKLPQICPTINIESTEKTPPRKNLDLSPIAKPPKVIQTKKIQPKSLKFENSDDEEPEPKKDSTCYKALPQFLNLGAKTPAPSTSKIKIYTDGKSGKKTKVEFKEPSTPVVKVEKGDNNLASRTKLLTERLKNSSKKNERKEDEEGKMKRVRQNLFEGCEGEKVALRRSARNKK